MTAHREINTCSKDNKVYSFECKHGKVEFTFCDKVFPKVDNYSNPIDRFSGLPKYWSMSFERHTVLDVVLTMEGLNINNREYFLYWRVGIKDDLNICKEYFSRELHRNDDDKLSEEELFELYEVLKDSPEVLEILDDVSGALKNWVLENREFVRDKQIEYKTEILEIIKTRKEISDGQWKIINESLDCIKY